jgi:starvation-inducible outer membrane lipoprotein
MKRVFGIIIVSFILAGCGTSPEEIASRTAGPSPDTVVPC